jgi:hypothetical protein
MTQPVCDGIRFHRGGDLVHEALVGERVLEARRRSQRPGEEQRLDGVR